MTLLSQKCFHSKKITTRLMVSFEYRILLISKQCKTSISGHPYFTYQNDFKHSTSLMQRDFSSLGIHINIKALLNKYRMFMILRWAYTYIYFMIQKPFVYKCFLGQINHFMVLFNVWQRDDSIHYLLLDINKS